jgi:hypothetical protein
MIDVLYDFIRNNLIGENTTITGADNLALLLTWVSIVFLFIVLIRLVMWAFFIVFKWNKKTYRS